MSIPQKFVYWPSFCAWCIYLLIVVAILNMAILGSEPNRKIYISASVFGISTVALMHFADMNGDGTLGFLIIDAFSSPSTDRAPWMYQAENISYLIDLGAASCMTFLGAWIGSCIRNDANGSE